MWTQIRGWSAFADHDEQSLSSDLAFHGETMPLDHIGFTVADFARSKAFYVAALAPLGLAIVSEGEGWALMGKDGRAELWFGLGNPPNPIHVAFTAPTQADVRAFHAAALATGGRDNGAPGI